MERHKPGLSTHPCTPQPDSAPRVTSSSRVLLQGLLQTSSSWLHLPLVHAADSQMPASSSSSCTPSPRPVPSDVPRRLGKPEFPDTGWARIKELFDKDESQRYPEELSNVVKSGLAAALAGLVYGGLPAARHAREQYIKISQAEIYTSRVDAVRSAHNAAIRGFIRYGWRWSWRVAAFVTLFNSVSTGMSVYRDKNALSHYVTAGAVTGGLFRLNLGLRGLLAGTLIGAVMGLPAGGLIMGMHSLTGETVRERRRRERRDQYDLKVAEWAARLQLADDLIGDLSVATATKAGEEDMRRIQELLNLPQNQGGVAKDQ